MISLTVLVSTYKRHSALRRCMYSLIKSGEFQYINVLVLINGVDAESEDLMAAYTRNFPNMKYVTSEHLSRGQARNFLIEHSPTSEILYFLDDDCFVDYESLSTLIDVAEVQPEVDCFGGPNLTPVDAGVFEQAQGYALGALWGSWLVRNRYRSYGKPRIVGGGELTLCNLAIRRRIFNGKGFSFNKDLVSGEENLLIDNLLRTAHKCMHIPHLIVFHERRKTICDFFRQIFTYGRGRCQIAWNSTGGFWLIYGACLLLASTALFLFFCSKISCIYLIAAYILLSCFNACFISWKIKNALFFPYLLYLFPTMHVAYCLGFMAQSFAFIVQRIKNLINKMAKKRLL